MSEQMNMLKCLAAADFACIECRLFLDTHPDCEQAAQCAKEYAQSAKCLRERYVQQFGPLTAADAALAAGKDCDCDSTVNSWISDPWPWDCVTEGRR